MFCIFFDMKPCVEIPKMKRSHIHAVEYVTEGHSKSEETVSWDHAVGGRIQVTMREHPSRSSSSLNFAAFLCAESWWISWEEEECTLFEQSVATLLHLAGNWLTTLQIRNTLLFEEYPCINPEHGSRKALFSFTSRATENFDLWLPNLDITGARLCGHQLIQAIRYVELAHSCDFDVKLYSARDIKNSPPYLWHEQAAQLVAQILNKSVRAADSSSSQGSLAWGPCLSKWSTERAYLRARGDSFSVLSWAHPSGRLPNDHPSQWVSFDISTV